MLVGLKRISAALGILAASAAMAHAQGIAPTANQSTADAVASTLRQSQSLSGYRIEIETKNGQVTLTGSVATKQQRNEAIALAKSVAGVRRVKDQLAVSGDKSVSRVQYSPIARGGHGGGMITGGTSVGGGVPSGPVYSTAAPATGMEGGPMPEGPAGMPGGSVTGQPGAPNYAWPNAAPYPNFSAVGYPTAYPWQAWPNIAPPYPYPEVPLDWRAVTLRWDDGIWWLDFKKHYTRPFFTPYPFGIFAY